MEGLFAAHGDARADDPCGASGDADAVTYEVYPSCGVAATAAELEKLRATLWQECVEDMRGYVWHADRFCLDVTERPGVLGGSVRVGECADDEWAVVHLLLRATARHPELAARVFDADGQFALIESAEVLPEWMDPSGMDNRVFLKGGRVLVVPTAPQNPAQIFALSQIAAQAVQNVDDCPPLALRDALAVVATAGAADAFHDADIQAVVDARIASLLPLDASTAAHTLQVPLPTPIACAVEHCPQLLSAAVAALHTPTPASLGPARAMPDFAPASVGTSRCMVRYTKLMHSMVVQSRFEPDPRHVSAEGGAGGEASNDEVLGAKIAAGFQAAYAVAKAEKAPEPPPAPTPAKAPTPVQQSSSAAAAPTPRPAATCAPVDCFEAELRRTRADREEKRKRRTVADAAAAAADASSAKPWAAYRRKLVQVGYFGNEVEGSRLWQEKERAAKRRFGFATAGVDAADDAAQAAAAASPVGAEETPEEAPAAASPAVAAAPRPSWLPCRYETLARDVDYGGGGGGAAASSPPQAVEAFDSRTGRARRFDAAVSEAIAGWAEGAKRALGRLPAQFPMRVEFALAASDGEEWMTVEPEALDRELASRFDPHVAAGLAADAARKKERGEKAEAFEASQEKLAEALKALGGFLGDESGHKGADACGADEEEAEAEAGGQEPRRLPTDAETRAYANSGGATADLDPKRSAAERAKDDEEDEGGANAAYEPVIATEWRFDASAYGAMRRKLLGVDESAASRGHAARGAGEGDEEQDADAGLDLDPETDLDPAMYADVGDLSEVVGQLKAMDAELAGHGSLDRVPDLEDSAQVQAGLYNGLVASMDAQGAKAGGPAATLLGQLV